METRVKNQHVRRHQHFLGSGGSCHVVGAPDGHAVLHAHGVLPAAPTQIHVEDPSQNSLLQNPKSDPMRAGIQEEPQESLQSTLTFFSKIYVVDLKGTVTERDRVRRWWSASTAVGAGLSPLDFTVHLWSHRNVA